MDAEFRRAMLRYYDERATEYEEAYVLGTGTSSINDPEIFKSEALALGEVVERVAGGRLVDLACGTGFWMPRYAAACPHITLFDQSERMLAECRAKAAALGITERCSFVRGDFFESPPVLGTFDTALVGFFLSHLTLEQEPLLFDVLEKMLGGSGQFLILDSAWTDVRARFNAKVGRQPRLLNDGTRFEIYKRYMDRDDISRWADTHGLDVSVEYFGVALMAVSGRFKS